MIPTQLFLSHATEDRRFTHAILKLFKKANIPVWYSESHIVGSQPWHDRIGAALSRCDWFAIVLSPQSLNSMWVRREWPDALAQTRLDGRIVPILYKPCNLQTFSWALPQIQYVDFTTSFKKGSRDLLRVWNIDDDLK